MRNTRQNASLTSTSLRLGLRYELLTLLFNTAVPPKVNTDDLGRHREVEPDAARAKGCDHDLALRVIFEVLECLDAASLAHTTVELLGLSC